MEKFSFDFLTTIIANYTVIHPTIWFTSGRASGRKKAAPILFINTPGNGALRGESPTLSANRLKKTIFYIIFLAILKVESSLIFLLCLILPI